MRLKKICRSWLKEYSWKIPGEGTQRGMSQPSFLSSPSLFLKSCMLPGPIYAMSGFAVLAFKIRSADPPLLALAPNRGKTSDSRFSEFFAALEMVSIVASVNHHGFEM